MSEHNKRNSIRPDGTASLLYALADSPTTGVWCSLGENSPAVAVFHTPRGCVARPGDTFQALCLHHLYTDGMIRGDTMTVTLLLDLTLSEKWSQEAGLRPLLRLGFTVRQLEAVLRTLPGTVVP